MLIYHGLDAATDAADGADAVEKKKKINAYGMSMHGPWTQEACQLITSTCLPITVCHDCQHIFKEKKRPFLKNVQLGPFLYYISYMLSIVGHVELCRAT